MDKKKLLEAIKKALEEKGKRKFRQSMELIVNMRGIDFSKPENRLNLDIALPAGKGGKEPKIGIIAEQALADKARKSGADLIILPDQIESYTNREKIKDLIRNYYLLAEPKLMGQVAKHLSKVLGPKGKLPKPITGDVSQLIDSMRRSVRVASKGKYFPVVQAFVGTEAMGEEELLENAETVYDAIKNKITESNVRSVYIKLSMGKSVKVG